MPAAPLSLTLGQIVDFRRDAGALDHRLPFGPDSLRLAAWAGLQDSMPRAALLSIHARVADTPATVLDDESLVQVWGPRYSAYAIAAIDLPIFTLSRLPDDPAGRKRAEDAADRLHEHLAGSRLGYGTAGDAIGVNANSLRYGATTGRIVIRWEGARQPVVWTVPRPNMDPFAARLELARRYLHVFGPSPAESFADWAGISSRAGAAAYEGLEKELIAVRTSIGDACLLASDEVAIRGGHSQAAPARLLPSGDAFFLLQGRQRELLVTDDERRPELWTPRVWPGALLVNGEITGVWRRANQKMSIETWRRLSKLELEAVEAEARSLPLPGLTRPIAVSFAQAA